MIRIPLLAALAVALMTGAPASPQASPPTMPAPLRAHLETERFMIVTSIRGLPLGVRQELERMFGGGLDIAEPGAPFQSDAASSRGTLPTRRLIAAGCANDPHCLIYYERGGATLTRHVALFEWSADRTRFEWGGTAPARLVTIDDVRKAMLSGAVRGNGGPW
jgi:hypothetical protein